MRWKLVEGTKAPAVRIDYISPAAHGASTARGYFIVEAHGIDCPHRHFKRAGAERCAAAMRRALEATS